MMWLLVSLATGLPLGAVWWLLNRLPQSRPPRAPMHLEDDGSDWRVGW